MKYTILFLLLLSSCAQKPQTQPRKVKYQKPIHVFDSQTEKAFEKYRRLRELGIPPKNQAPKYRPPETTQKIYMDPQELDIIIEQKTSWYCLENENRTGFKKISCKDSIALSKKDCSDRFDSDDRNLLDCIMKDLKKRSN